MKDITNEVHELKDRIQRGLFQPTSENEIPDLLEKVMKELGLNFNCSNCGIDMHA